MNTSAFIYVILVAALGMGIVFLFLWFLSGVMSLIKRVFGEREQLPRPVKNEALQTLGEAPIAYRGNNWLIAAVAAYLEAEQLDQSSDPGPWITGRAHHEDPWLSAPSRSEM